MAFLLAFLNSIFLKILDCVLNGHQLIAVIPIIKTEHLSQIFYKDTVNGTNSVFCTTAANLWQICLLDCKWKKVKEDDIHE